MDLKEGGREECKECWEGTFTRTGTFFPLVGWSRGRKGGTQCLRLGKGSHTLVMHALATCGHEIGRRAMVGARSMGFGAGGEEWE